MKLKHIFVIVVCLLFLFLLVHSLTIDSENEFSKFYFGVDVAYADLAKIKALVDQIADYTNFHVIGSTGVSHHQSDLNQTIAYLVNHNLDYAIFTASARSLPSINETVSQYSDGFIGIYYDDEIAGHQLDQGHNQFLFSADNYSHASTQFLEYIRYRLNASFYQDREFSYLVPSDFRLFTSDYALYWFVYKAGYDVVLAQFGWNYSRQQNVALCRGAATVMDKDWGVIITWTYTDPPYLGSGEELFDDLVLAYENGAKYILVFDSNEDYTQSTLGEAHLDALERFWQYTKDNPRPADLLDGRVAFVLPKDYAYGIRGPNDKIWGLWEADSLSFEISENIGKLLKQYRDKLDIIYDDGLELDSTYDQYFFWNGTSCTP